MTTLRIDWADLELAFRDATGAVSYLDAETGEIFTLMVGFEDERELKERLKRSPARYLKLQPVDKAFTTDVLVRFVERQTRGQLKERMQEAMTGPGGLARAMALLRDDKPAFASFARFEQTELLVRAEEFLKAHGIVAGEPAPSPELFEGMLAG